MTLSRIGCSLVMGMAFTMSGVFAADGQALQNEARKAPKSILPSSAFQANDISTDDSQDDSKIVSITNKPQALMQSSLTYGGGYGGNEQTGVLIYDGLPNHLPVLMVRRDNKKEKCYLEDRYAGVYHKNYFGLKKLVSYKCASTKKNHNGVYWNDKLSNNNGAYFPDNDVLYASFMTNKMFEQWFGFPVTSNSDGSPIPLKFVYGYTSCGGLCLGKHHTIYWNKGDRNFYPMTSPAMIAAILSFQFTEDHSNLDYYKSESGAIYIAFAMMTGEALKFYINGDSDWQIGSDISKSGRPIYYQDQPSKDCGNRRPGDNCTIDHMSQYTSKMSVYQISGVYRRAFYLLATSPNWDIKKAFTVMVHANRYYWTEHETLRHGVCGVVKAAGDLHYDQFAVVDAFNQVGLNPNNC